VVSKKSEHIQSLESDLKLFKKRLQKSLKAQTQEYASLKLDEEQWKDTAVQKVKTPFYMYLSDKVDFRRR